ncbi:ArnT family glycosyltransferase [Sunxiuqinia sp. A32]|uniref:ArnT family glycosyltransferase n=1 Tax=Sunxiuqinia sp. A32 TaxID=3461496 RepID=UPI0040457EBF
MFEKNNLRWLVLFAIIFALITYYFGLFIDLTGDAGKYAAIAKNIFIDGDFINLKIHGDPYDQKPPLLFWLSTLGFHTFGLTNFGYKFFAVLYALIGVFATYKLAESLYNKRSGIIAAITIFTSQIYFLYCMDVHTDTILQANVAFALWQLHDYLKKRKTLNFILAFVGIGLAMMSKGPIGGAVPAFALGTHLLLKGDFKEIFKPKWIIGIAIALLTASPALIGLYNQFGLEGIKFFFITNNVGRITGNYVGSNTDYIFYLHTILYIYAPWSFLLVGSLFLEFRSLIKNKFKHDEYFTFGGIWIFFIILSIAKGKAPNYLFILIPLFTALLSKWIDWIFTNGTKKLRNIFENLQISMVGLSWIVLLSFMIYLFPTDQFAYWTLVLVILIMTIYIYTRKNIVWIKLFVPGMLIITLINFYLNTQVLPYTFQYQSSIAATRTFNKDASDDAVLYNYNYEQFELFFYGKNEAVHIKDWEMLNKAAHTPNSWIFCYEPGLEDIKSMNTPIDTIYTFKHRGMNRVGIQFILPETREKSLKNTYLVKTK